jgi:hypothetical protein
MATRKKAPLAIEIDDLGRPARLNNPPFLERILNRTRQPANR